MYMINLTKQSRLHVCRSITAKDFITTVRSHLKQQQQQQGEASSSSSPALLFGVTTCSREEPVKDVILRLDDERIQRAYVTDGEGALAGVITLRDIISRLVHEPNGYFGDFFDGVVPLPQNSRV